MVPISIGGDGGVTGPLRALRAAHGPPPVRRLGPGDPAEAGDRFRPPRAGEEGMLVRVVPAVVLSAIMALVLLTKGVSWV